MLEHGLAPAERDGHAQIMIVAAGARYMGIRFRELSCSVQVAPPDGHQMAAFLLGAFNSNRFFAFCERAFFSTPYDHGDVRLSTSFPVTIEFVKNGEVAFRAQMETDASGREREPSRHGENLWEGPVFLRKSPRGRDRRGKFFLVQPRGDTKSYPFLPPKDSLTIKSGRDGGLLQALADSHFVAKEWYVSADAAHARSKTYERAHILPIDANAESSSRSVT